MLLYGDPIKKRANKIKQMLVKMITVKQTHSHMEELSSKMPDVAFNYKELREPLVELD